MTGGLVGEVDSESRRASYLVGGSFRDLPKGPDGEAKLGLCADETLLYCRVKKVCKKMRKQR